MAFISLGVPLLLSGVIILAEQQKLNSWSESVKTDLIGLNNTGQMLGGIIEQNAGYAGGSDSLWISGVEKFETAFTSAQITIRTLPAMNNISTAYHNYTVAAEQSTDDYNIRYGELIAAINSLDKLIISKISEQESRRSGISPAILAIIVTFSIIGLFYFFLNSYFVKPVYKINEGLQRFLNSHVPFNVKMEGKNEISELKDNIEELIEELKSKKIE